MMMPLVVLLLDLRRDLERPATGDLTVVTRIVVADEELPLPVRIGAVEDRESHVAAGERGRGGEGVDAAVVGRFEAATRQLAGEWESGDRVVIEGDGEIVGVVVAADIAHDEGVAAVGGDE